MRKSKFAISIHILTLLATFQEEWLSSKTIASSLNVNPVLVRNEIALLLKHNLVHSKEGKNGGAKLLKQPKDILLSEIFKIVKGNAHLLSHAKNIPNVNCIVGKKINQNLTTLFDSVDEAIAKELSNITLEAFKNKF